MSELNVGQLKGLTVNNNIIQVPSGHTLYSPGHIIQVITVENVARTVQSNAINTFVNVSGMEASITPKKSNSKILIQARWFGELTPAGSVYNSVFGLTRDGVQVGRQPDPGATIISGLTSPALSYEGTDANSTPETAMFFVTDTPNTTNTIVYRMTYIADAAGTIYTNRTLGYANQATGYELGTSSMVLMEIAA